MSRTDKSAICENCKHWDNSGGFGLCRAGLPHEWTRSGPTEWCGRFQPMASTIDDELREQCRALAARMRSYAAVLASGDNSVKPGAATRENDVCDVCGECRGQCSCVGFQKNFVKKPEMS